MEQNDNRVHFPTRDYKVVERPRRHHPSLRPLPVYDFSTTKTSVVIPHRLNEGFSPKDEMKVMKMSQMYAYYTNIGLLGEMAEQVAA